MFRVVEKAWSKKFVFSIFLLIHGKGMSGSSASTFTPWVPPPSLEKYSVFTPRTYKPRAQCSGSRGRAEPPSQF